MQFIKLFLNLLLMALKEKWPREVSKFNGFTVDFRLKQFRRVDKGNRIIEFIDFDSERGKKILKEYREFISKN